MPTADLAFPLLVATAVVAGAGAVLYFTGQCIDWIVRYVLLCDVRFIREVLTWNDLSAVKRRRLQDAARQVRIAYWLNLSFAYLTPVGAVFLTLWPTSLDYALLSVLFTVVATILFTLSQERMVMKRYKTDELVDEEVMAAAADSPDAREAAERASVPRLLVLIDRSRRLGKRVFVLTIARLHPALQHANREDSITNAVIDYVVYTCDTAIREEETRATITDRVRCITTPLAAWSASVRAENPSLADFTDEDLVRRFTVGMQRGFESAAGDRHRGCPELLMDRILEFPRKPAGNRRFEERENLEVVEPEREYTSSGGGHAARFTGLTVEQTRHERIVFVERDEMDRFMIERSRAHSAKSKKKKKKKKGGKRKDRGRAQGERADHGQLGKSSGSLDALSAVRSPVHEGNPEEFDLVRRTDFVHSSGRTGYRVVLIDRRVSRRGHDVHPGQAS